jgi:hypothetical protein
MANARTYEVGVTLAPINYSVTVATKAPVRKFQLYEIYVVSGDPG